MDRSTRPPPLKLIANYHNFSYPRVRSAECPCPSTMTSTASSSCQCSPTAASAPPPMDRSSVGSEASAPGLIDDGSDDSDLSPDEDFQSHVLSPCLWDSSSVWEPSKTDLAQDCAVKPFPTLLPLPASSSFAARRCSKSLSGCPTVAAWPLPNTGPRDRKPAADYTTAKSRPTYSAIPKPMLPNIVTDLPHRMASLSPILVTEPDACASAISPPPRSARRPVPPPLIRHIIPSEAQSPSVPKPSPKAVSKSYELLAPSPALRKFPSSPGLEQVAARAPPVPSLTDFLAYDPEVMCRAPQVCQSIAHIGPPRPAPRPEPQQFNSFFDYDTDSDCPSDGERGDRSFFRFNRRSDSQGGRRRSAKGLSPSAVDPSAHSSKHQTPAYKRQTHVLGRMLGRRSR